MIKLRQHANNLNLSPASLLASSLRCLFNVTRDPCEYHDLAAQMPEVVKSLRQRLKVRQGMGDTQVTQVRCSHGRRNKEW